MGRQERPINPDEDPIQSFAFALRCLRESAGRPGYRELSKRAHYSVTALAEAAGGSVFPSLPVTLAYVQACGGDPRVWTAHWRAAAAAVAAVTAARGGSDRTDEPPEAVTTSGRSGRARADRADRAGGTEGADGAVEAVGAQCGGARARIMSAALLCATVLLWILVVVEMLRHRRSRCRRRKG